MRHGPGAALARAAYALLLRLALPLYAVRVLWRGRREPLYAQAIGERFGLYRGAPPLPGALWVHAVSLGETLAAAPLLAALRDAEPALRIVLTHGTATGRAAGQPLLRAGDLQCWLPFDTPGAAARFLDRVRPAAGVLLETEIWPNLLAAAAKRALPVLLANARRSATSHRRGRRVDALLRPAFASLAAACAQSEADAERLRDAGVARVDVLGNLKFDATPDPALLARGRQWNGATGGRGVLLGAVTREGEEEPLFALWRALPAPRPLLVVVPRHPQRFDAVAALAAAAGLTLSRRSAWADGPPPAATDADVWLGDSMQEMPAWYGLADVALLGGSFAPLGGQNLIEAAACGCPVVMGPHTFNFAEAAALALAAGAALRAPDLATAVATALALLGGDDERTARAQAALAFAATHRGAARRTAAEVLALWRAAPRPGRSL